MADNEKAEKGSKRSQSKGSSSQFNNVSTDKQLLKVDTLLSKIGGFGRYQIFLVICLGLGGAVYCSAQNLSLIYIESLPEWVCLTDFCLAQVNGTYSLWTLCNSDLKDGVDWKWVNGNHTAISDFNKACGSHVVITNVLYFCPGVIIGGLTFGSMGLSTGRKTPFLTALLTSMTASVISAASNSYVMFVVLRILLGASMAGYECLYFCWIIELVSRKWRPIAVALQGLFWAGGLIVVHYVNMYWEYWRYKMVYVGIVSLVFIFVYAAVPESPYWLLVQGQEEISTMVLKKISILNGKTYPGNHLQLPCIKGKEKAATYFQPKFKRIGIYMCLNWFLVGLVYYHIFLTLKEYSGVYSTNYFLIVGVEVPACIIGCALIISVLGRKMAFMFNTVFFIICATVSLLQYDIYTGWPLRRAGMLIGAKWAITASKLSLALWTAEIAPTSTRTVFYGICLGASACGVVASSALVYFAATPLAATLFMVIVAIVCVLGSTQVRDTSTWDLPNCLFDVFKLLHNEDVLYSDLQSENPAGGLVSAM